MFHNIGFWLLFSLFGYAACTANIPDAVKTEYGTDFQNAFIYQSEGLSTHATYYFEQGCMKAMKANENPQKIEALRKFFVWYRTYGYYLGLISKDPEIFGQYIGNGKYSSSVRLPRSLNSKTYSSKSEMRSDYLFGVVEILAGILCFTPILPPTPGKYVLGVSLVAKGTERVWDVVRPLLFQDIPSTELKKVNDLLKSAE